MKCPECNEEMEYGAIKSIESGIYYLPDGKDDFWQKTKEIVEMNGGFYLDGPFWTRLKHAKVPCWNCRKCRKIVISY